MCVKIKQQVYTHVANKTCTHSMLEQWFVTFWRRKVKGSGFTYFHLTNVWHLPVILVIKSEIRMPVDRTVRTHSHAMSHNQPNTMCILDKTCKQRHKNKKQTTKLTGWGEKGKLLRLYWSNMTFRGGLDHLWQSFGTENSNTVGTGSSVTRTHTRDSRL